MGTLNKCCGHRATPWLASKEPVSKLLIITPIFNAWRVARIIPAVVFISQSPTTLMPKAVIVAIAHFMINNRIHFTHLRRATMPAILLAYF